MLRRRAIHTQYTTVDDRLRAVSGFDAKTCRRALVLNHLQITVRIAIERRMRKLGAAR